MGDTRTIIKEINNLVYIKQAFANPIAIAEKRSFIFCLKSFVVRNQKGILCGIYSYLKNNSITIFYPDLSIKQNNLDLEPIRKNVKFSLDDIGSEKMTNELSIIAKYIIEMKMDINMPSELENSEWSIKYKYALNYLNEMLNSYKNALKDKKFVQEFIVIDLWIEDEL